MNPAIRNAILTGVVLGIIAGAVVWYLEKFETQKMFSQIDDILGAHARFDDWERGQNVGN
jgi:hypothetical protein